MKYVNVYETSRCYGGPEEGGWWFTSGELQFSLGPIPTDEAYDLAESVRLNDKEKIKEYRMGFTSMDGCDPDGEGDDNFLTVGGAWGRSDIKAYVQDKPGVQFFPSERPYYE